MRLCFFVNVNLNNVCIELHLKWKDENLTIWRCHVVRAVSLAPLGFFDSKAYHMMEEQWMLSMTVHSQSHRILSHLAHSVSPLQQCSDSAMTQESLANLVLVKSWSWICLLATCVWTCSPAPIPTPPVSTHHKAENSAKKKWINKYTHLQAWINH